MPGFHPALYFSRRRAADLLDHRARGGARRPQTRAPRIVRRQLCADLARMARPLPARLAEARAARLQRPLPPHVGILPRLLRSRLSHRLDRRRIFQADGVTPDRGVKAPPPPPVSPTLAPLGTDTEIRI